VVDIPEVDGRAPGPGDLAGASDDNAEEVLTVDLLGEGFAEVVEEVVDDFLFLLKGVEFTLILGLQAAAFDQLPASVKEAQDGDDSAKGHEVPENIMHSD
jgi:hypothetical protein